MDRFLRLSFVVLLVAISAVVTTTGALSDSTQTRIVGGESTTIEQYPSIVQVDVFFSSTQTWSQSCGGNILTSRWILSAAHCFIGYVPELLRIRAGSTWRNQGGSTHGVWRVFDHPEYNVRPQDADLSLLLLQTPLVWSAAVQPVSILAQGSVVPDNVPVQHAGWGLLQWGGSAPLDLQHVTVNTVNRDVCRQRYGQTAITEGMICAGILDVGGKDACQMDSGGPMYFSGILVGVVSWGSVCGDAFFPGVSAYVPYFTDWIVQTVDNNS